MNFNGNEYLKEFGIQVDSKMMIIEDARILPPPPVRYHHTSRDAQFQPHEGKWNLRDKKVITGMILNSWSVISFATDRELRIQDVQNFIRELTMTCQNTGMNIPNKTPEITISNPQGDIPKIMTMAYQKAGNQANLQPQLILCILPNSNAALYAEIKKTCETGIGVPTQCIQLKHAKLPKKQYCANVCLKINLKLGGVNSILDPTSISFVTSKPTIIFGADVSHPGANGGIRPKGMEETRPSIATLVASLDINASKYASAIRNQSARTELILDLQGMVKELLQAFFVTSKCPPQRILFYRDGVSEGEFQKVLQNELLAIQQACESLQAGYRPPITFVVVQKRHHAKFFPLNGKDADRSGNCPPGTLVETKITHPTHFDFYLQSHAGLQGTCKSAHYQVLKDENGFSPDQLQDLTYKLCYLYGRCTSVVSLVPSVYYAHLVANRTRIYSTSGSGNSEEAGGEGKEYDVQVKLKKIMYYM